MHFGFMLFKGFLEGFGGEGVVGRMAAMFSEESFFKRHHVTLCRSAKLKQMFGNTRQSHD